MSQASTTIPRDLLSNYDVMFMFGKSVQWIYVRRRNWGLPFYRIPGGSIKTQPVRYSLSEVLDWAQKHGIIVRCVPTTTPEGAVRWPKARRKEFRKFQRQAKF